MFRKGDVVVRITTPTEGSVVKGTRAIVASVTDSQYMTLEGHHGQFMQVNFRPDSLGSSERKPTVSDLESMEHALQVIDNWNRTHPTAAMVSIQAYPAQDGGSVFMTTNNDYNSIEGVIKRLGELATSDEKKASLRKAIGLMQMEIGDE